LSYRCDRIVEVKDRFESFRKATARALFESAGATPQDLRAAVASDNAPPPLAELVAKIRTHAYQVTDEDIDALRSAYGDEGLFEIIVAATYGTASDKLAAARRALEEA
jgi:hypothetical protein